jgi:hypothetical protein
MRLALDILASVSYGYRMLSPTLDFRTGSNEHGNEPSDSTKGGEFLD